MNIHTSTVYAHFSWYLTAQVIYLRTDLENTPRMHFRQTEITIACATDSLPLVLL